MNPFPEDIVDRVHQYFGDRADDVLSLLMAHRQSGNDNYFDDRLVRCAIFAAREDADRIPLQIQLGLEDYRDLIMAGEYDECGRRLRNLTASFLVEGDQNFWIESLAEMMQLRGYHLTNLLSRPATLRASPSLSNAGEGKAVFVGPKGHVAIEKSD